MPIMRLALRARTQVMRVVRALVARGITICATIHCPPPHTFTLFDRALIMQRGRVVYFGPNGQPSIDYFYDHFEKAHRNPLLSLHLFCCAPQCIGGVVPMRRGIVQFQQTVFPATSSSSKQASSSRNACLER